MSNSSFSFTFKSIENLRPADKTQWFTDAKQAGLSLTLSKAGTRSFWLYRRINGKPTRIKLGDFPAMSPEDARDRVRRMLAEKTAPTTGSATFGDAFRLWLESYAKKNKRTWQEDQRKFDRDLTEFHNVKLSKLTREAIERFHNRKAEENSGSTANRLLSLLKAVLSFAVRCPDLAFNGPSPAADVRKFREESRSRRLHRDEIGRFLEAVEAEGQPYSDLFKCLLFTAARLGNVTTMKWQDVDLQAGVWLIPQTKSGKPVALPLAPEVVAILSRRKEAAAGPWVFPSNRKPWDHVADVRKSWARVLHRAEIENLTRHDLRRTLASWQAQSGTSTQIIGRTLGHADGSRATHVYARMDLEPVRKSINATVSQMLQAASKEGR